MYPTRLLGYILAGEDDFVEEIHYTKVGLSVRTCHQEMDALRFRNEHEAKCWMAMINITLEEDGSSEKYQVGCLGITVAFPDDQEGNGHV